MSDRTMRDDSEFGKMIPIGGNTYPVREQLKEIGGRWDPEQRVWMVPEQVAATARRIVSSVKRLCLKSRPCTNRGASAQKVGVPAQKVCGLHKKSPGQRPANRSVTYSVVSSDMRTTFIRSA